jgi:hypothetical protein
VFWTQKTRPRSRAEGLLVEQVNDEIVVFDTESREAHCLSPLAAVVFDHCDGRVSPEGMAALATERLGEPFDVAGVEEALAQLDERKLLEPTPGMTRRSMIGKSAVAGGAVFAAPMIMSVFPPAAAAAGSATCGAAPGEQGPTVLCCPCNTTSTSNKDECCQPPFTNKCTCTSAQGDSTKFCHPSGVASGHDAICHGAGRPPCTQCCANQTGVGCGALTTATLHGDAGNCVGPCPTGACGDRGVGGCS